MSSQPQTSSNFRATQSKTCDSHDFVNIRAVEDRIGTGWETGRLAWPDLFLPGQCGRLY